MQLYLIDLNTLHLLPKDQQRVISNQTSQQLLISLLLYQAWVCILLCLPLLLMYFSYLILSFASLILCISLFFFFDRIFFMLGLFFYNYL